MVVARVVAPPGLDESVWVADIWGLTKIWPHAVSAVISIDVKGDYNVSYALQSPIYATFRYNRNPCTPLVPLLLLRGFFQFPRSIVLSFSVCRVADNNDDGGAVSTAELLPWEACLGWVDDNYQWQCIDRNLVQLAPGT